MSAPLGLWHAPNGLLLTGMPSTVLAAAWWRCGARARIDGLPRERPFDALSWLCEAGRAGWDAMDAAIKKRDGGGTKNAGTGDAGTNDERASGSGPQRRGGQRPMWE